MLDTLVISNVFASLDDGCAPQAEERSTPALDEETGFSYKSHDVRWRGVLDCGRVLAMHRDIVLPERSQASFHVSACTILVFVYALGVHWALITTRVLYGLSRQTYKCLTLSLRLALGFVRKVRRP